MVSPGYSEARHIGISAHRSRNICLVELQTYERLGSSRVCSFSQSDCNGIPLDGEWPPPSISAKISSHRPVSHGRTFLYPPTVMWTLTPDLESVSRSSMD